MDPKGKGIVINDKEKESFVNEPKDDKPTDSGSGHKRKDGKKRKTRRIKVEEKKGSMLPRVAPELSMDTWWYYKAAHLIDQS